MNIPSLNITIPEKSQTKRFYGEIFLDKIYALDTVVDIGANIGLFSYYISPFARNIYAVEPHRPSFTLFQEVVTKESLTHIHPFELAIGKKNELRSLSSFEDIDDGGYKLLDHLPLYPEVQAVTLATFIQDYAAVEHVDLLKIDCENAEGEIFQAEDIDLALSKISLIVGEGHDFEVVGPVLEKNGFTITHRPGGFFARK